jgi:hypothetical protein
MAVLNPNAIRAPLEERTYRVENLPRLSWPIHRDPRPNSKRSVGSEGDTSTNPSGVAKMIARLDIEVR